MRPGAGARREGDGMELITAGAEDFCEGCPARIREVDECGVSWKCASSDDCALYDEARSE
jgi:hypothetical protein